MTRIHSVIQTLIYGACVVLILIGFVWVRALAGDL
jgi:hypothetical protein